MTDILLLHLNNTWQVKNSKELFRFFFSAAD
jgi:hypothetical protein